MQIITHIHHWHHLDICMVTLDGRAVRAGVFDRDGTRIGASAPGLEGWSAVEGTSLNLPKALAVIAKKVKEL